MVPQNRHTISQHIALLLVVFFGTIGAGCGGSDGEPDGQESALPGPSATVVLLSYLDLDHDGDMDLEFTTRSGDTFVSTLLLNQGGGNFTVQQSRPTAMTTTVGGQVELKLPDERIEAGKGNIGVLERELVGLSQAIEMLTDDRREALGVDNRGRARGYYDCPIDYACGFEHAYWAGGVLQVRPDINIPDLGRWNDAITGIRNRSRQCWVDWWINAEYTGDHYGQSPGNDVYNVGNYWNDKFSAVHWGLGCPD